MKRLQGFLFALIVLGFGLSQSSTIRIDQVRGLLDNLPHNPIWYGADNTGTNDSTTAIQTAINNAARDYTTGGNKVSRVVLPLGRYKISSALTLKAGVIFEGAMTLSPDGGAGTEIVTAAGTAGPMLKTESCTNSNTYAHHTQLRNIRFDAANTTSGNAIEICAPGELVQIENLLVANSYTNCLAILPSGITGGTPFYLGMVSVNKCGRSGSGSGVYLSGVGRTIAVLDYVSGDNNSTALIHYSLGDVYSRLVIRSFKSERWNDPSCTNCPANRNPFAVLIEDGNGMNVDIYGGYLNWILAYSGAETTSAVRNKVNSGNSGAAINIDAPIAWFTGSGSVAPTNLITSDSSYYPSVAAAYNGRQTVHQTRGGEIMRNINLFGAWDDYPLRLGNTYIWVDGSGIILRKIGSPPSSISDGSPLVAGTRTITCNNGLTGGGDLSADRTCSLASVNNATVLTNISGASAVPSATAWTSIHIAGTLASRPAASASNAGLLYFATDVNGGTLYRSDGSAWAAVAAGVSSGGAPSNASYVTAVAEAGLSNETALGALASGLLINTTTTGIPTIYGGTNCTNQFVRSLNASGAATCATVALGSDVNGTLQAAQFPALTGDVTTTAGSLATTIANNTVSNSNLAQMGANTVKCNNTGSTANATDCTAAQSETINRSGRVDSIERTLPFYSSDFFNNTGTNPFTNSAIASGTNSTAPAAGTITTAHPGIVLLRSSTSANSGYRYDLGLSQATAGQIRLGGGEQFDAVIRMPAALTNNTIRLGWHDCTTSADCVDGVYVEIPSTGAAVCKASSNSTRTTSSTIATLSTSTWYHIRVKVNSTSSADCTIWNDAGSQQGTQNVASNIPSASGREVGAGIIGTNSGTTASDIVAVDYMSVAWTTALQRGK